MSAIGGILNFDRRPVDEDLVTDLATGLVSRGPDSGANVNHGSVAMVYQAFWTNRESRLETQPLVSDSGHILCWDGRLDNRDELIWLLRDELHTERTDVAIVMSGYVKWGPSVLTKMVGNFAFSLWDPASRTLLLARDIIGAHDLYYQRSRDRIIWSTDLRTLLTVSGIDVEVDEDYIAAYITRLPEPWQTPFKNIDVVPPAHSVVVTETGIKVKRYWNFDPTREIRYKTDTEYEEHFRNLLIQAVKCCLQSDSPVWSDLSGGLDSSTIVCLADQLIRSGQAEAPKLETVSCIRDESVSSNELKFIRAVETKIGRQGHHLPESTFPILSPAKCDSSIIPNVLDIFAAYHAEVNRLMAESGARVRLCGNGGDEILNSMPDPASELGDCLVSGSVLKLHRGLRAWGRQLKKPYVKLLWGDAIVPVLPRKMQVALKHGPVKRLPAWLNAEFVRRKNLPARMLGPRDLFGFEYPSGRIQAVGFLAAVKEVSAGYCRALQNVEIRLPLLHQPLVEFMQAIPREQRARAGETRSLQRRALRDVLPDEILKRKGKGNPIEAIFRAGYREYPRLQALLSDSFVARYGYVDQEPLMNALERLRYGDRRAMEIYRIIPLEFWLRSLERLRAEVRIGAAVMGAPEAQQAAV